MKEFEPKKRVTKNDKKNKKGVYTTKHLRIVEQLYEKRRDNEAVNRISGSSVNSGVFKSNTPNSELPSYKGS
jgi:hypothetical protein|tara:strand:+ start:876 stop:1091 length:216 start_codon:yes stop_codon:yes gene_type:complete